MFSKVEIFVMIIFVVIIIVFIQHVRKRSRHPPGPLGFPYLGMLPFRFIQVMFSNYLPKIPQMNFNKWIRKTYGDVWSVEIGGQRIVTLASFDVINEALINGGKFFSARPDNGIFSTVNSGKGILLVNGNVWKTKRAMALRAFRELEMGKHHVFIESNLFTEHLVSKSECPIDGSSFFIQLVSNIMTKFFYNERFNYGDAIFPEIMKNFICAIHSDAINTKCSLFLRWSVSKFTRSIFPDVDGYINGWTGLRQFNARLGRKIEEHENVEPNCVFDYFWRYQYQDNLEMTNETKLEEITLTMTDIFVAGTGTTNSLISFCFLMLGRYPEIQNELRCEIQDATNDYRQINMIMRKDCPKLLSFIDEVNRFCNPVPNLHRKVLENCMFRGYQLYTDDIIIGDLRTIFRDELLFENPDEFDPYRFMDKSRTRYVASKYMIPFSIGKRACIAESLVNMIMFLLISRLVLTFEITLTSETLNNFQSILEGRLGFVRGPLEHNIILRLL